MKKLTTAIISMTVLTGGLSAALPAQATVQEVKPRAMVKKTKKPLTIKQRKITNAAELRRSLVVAAKKRLNGRGKYVAGASSPWRFDCSGFTKYLYKSVVKKTIPHYSGAQMKRSKRIHRKNLKAGDLLFWGHKGSQHVSMYIGGGKMIGANNPRRNVVIESINAPWWRHKYAGAGQPSEKLLPR